MAPRTSKQNKATREKTRQQIRDAAFQLFAQKGFAHTSVGAIAKKATISKGLIYYYFDSKEDILKNIFQHWVQTTEYMLDFSDDLAAGEKIKKMIAHTFSFIKEQPKSSRLMMALALQPDAIAAVKSYIHEVNKKQIEIATSLLKEMNYNNPEKEACYLGAKLNGVIFGYLTRGNDYPLEAMQQKLLKEYMLRE